MSIIKVKCTDQVLTYENTPVIASGGLEENFIEFSFCGQWDGYVRTAVFWQAEAEAYHVVLDENNSGQVPPEVTAVDGVIYIGVFGVNPDGRRRTSNVLTYRIEKGAITTGTIPSDPTPEIYTQLLQKCAETVGIAAEIKAAEEAFEQAMTQRQTEHETDVAEAQTAFEQAMTAAQAAFEQAMTQRQTEHETDVAAEQAAFEQAMVAAQAAYEAKVSGMVEDHVFPDGFVTTEKLADQAVTAAKLATTVWTDTSDTDSRVGETLYITDDSKVIMPGPYYNSYSFSEDVGFVGTGDNVYTNIYLALLADKYYVAPDGSYVVYYSADGVTTDSEAGTLTIPYSYIATAAVEGDPVKPGTIGAAPAIQYGTEDVTDGAVSPYPDGTLYVVIE